MNNVQAHVHDMLWSRTIISSTGIALMSVLKVSRATEMVSQVAVAHLREGGGVGLRFNICGDGVSPAISSSSATPSIEFSFNVTSNEADQMCSFQRPCQLHLKSSIPSSMPPFSSNLPHSHFKGNIGRLISAETHSNALLHEIVLIVPQFQVQLFIFASVLLIGRIDPTLIWLE